MKLHHSVWGLLLAVLPVNIVAQQAPSPGASVPAHLRSWTSDQRPHEVGEILTVLISERTIASATGDARNEHARSTGFSAGGGAGGVVDLPAVNLSGEHARQEADKDAIQRRDQFVGELAVRIVEITAEGMLRIEGEREVRIDNRKRRLRLSGLVRPEDVSARGLVHSTRVADAVIDYRGGASRTRGGMLGRVLGWLWPL